MITLNNVQVRVVHHKRSLLKRIGIVLERGVFFDGLECKKLLRKLTKLYKTNHITLTSSGHDSLILALQSLRLSPADEVIVPVNSYPTAFPVALSHCSIVLCDVDENGLLSLKELKKKITKKTKAIIVVHLFGNIVDVDVIRKSINKKIIVIEDCAQAFGSLLNGKPVGTLGDFGCFSFYPTKNVGTAGDGGFVLCKSAAHHRYITRAVKYGASRRFQSEFVSGHSRIPEIQAAVVNNLLPTFKDEIKKKQAVLKRYHEGLAKMAPAVRILAGAPHSKPVVHLLVIETPYINSKLIEYLYTKKISADIHYPVPIHLLKAFRYLNIGKGSFPIAERLSNKCISIPFHSSLTNRQISSVCREISQYHIR